MSPICEPHWFLLGWDRAYGGQGQAAELVPVEADFFLFFCHFYFIHLKGSVGIVLFVIFIEHHGVLSTMLLRLYYV